ncbi:MAG: hypothetical protein GC181_14270 [Bacteroidetes bacterium]|nr:hypothetical protein [Bacteroidota bacterium]
MFYLADPNRETANYIHVLARSSTGNFPNQISCGGRKYLKNGKQNTGQTETVSCLEAGSDDIPAEIWVDALPLL